MASPFDQRAFVRAVLDRLSLTPTELGDLLGKRNAYNAVNSWVTENPKNFRKLGYDDTMRMLELCGWLNIGEGGLGAATPRDPLGELAKGVAALEKGQAKVVRLLEARQEAQKSPRKEASKGTRAKT